MIAFLGLVTLLGGCGAGEEHVDILRTTTSAPSASSTASGDLTSQEPDAPEASDTPTGPVVAEVTVEQTIFRLHDEGNDCVAIQIDHPGLQVTVERGCFSPGQVLARTDSCGWLVGRSESDRGCDVELPQAIFGRVVSPEIGFVCVGTIVEPGGAEGVVSARFVPFDQDGFILGPLGDGEAAASHLFTQTGLRYGEPPLDAPSAPIYRFCEEQAPWGTTEISYSVELVIEVEEAIQRPDLIVTVSAGAGDKAFASNAGSYWFLTVAIPASSKGLDVTLAEEGGPVLASFQKPWPTEVVKILESDGGCRGPIHIRFGLNEAALGDNPDGLDLDLLTANCS